MTSKDQVPRHERLVDALADDILGATDADILATHTEGTARVVAGGQRQALQRAIALASDRSGIPRTPPRVIPVRPDQDEEERR